MFVLNMHIRKSNIVNNIQYMNVRLINYYYEFDNEMNYVLSITYDRKEYTSYSFHNFQTWLYN